MDNNKLVSVKLGEDQSYDVARERALDLLPPVNDGQHYLKTVTVEAMNQRTKYLGKGR